MKRIIIVGGGPSGLMAAISAAEAGSADVTLLEQNPYCGKKLNITGKGRCNMTNACDLDTFLQNVPVNSRFLYKALTQFGPEDTIAFFEAEGVPTKTERGRRVFPESDKARDVTDALVKKAKSLGVHVLQGKATALHVCDGTVTGIGVKLSREQGERILGAKEVILCTGGKSYPLTGSTGDGYRLAKEVGHSIVDPKPSLVPLVSDTGICHKCMGLSLKNVGIRIEKDGKELYQEQGEMLFTHFGVSGPIVLSASAHLRCNYPVVLHLDMKPALDEKTLDTRLLRDFSESKNKDLRNCMNGLLPAKMIQPFLDTYGFDGGKKVNAITREERQKLEHCLKDIEIKIIGTRPIEEAIVTSGGVSVKEINPKNMRSKLINGLLFAGELIDVDAYTGGYNLQIAFATGRLAGKTAAETEE